MEVVSIDVITIGSYTCSCDDGYLLADDKVTYEGILFKIFWITSKEDVALCYFPEKTERYCVTFTGRENFN